MDVSDEKCGLWVTKCGRLDAQETTLRELPRSMTDYNTDAQERIVRNLIQSWELVGRNYVLGENVVSLEEVAV